MINPPTISLWINLYMVQWDIYIEEQASKWEQIVNGRMCQFKKPSEESY